MTTPMSPSLRRLLDQLGPADQLDFPRFLAAIYRVSYTGSITLHCLNGIPQQIDLGSPIRLSIVDAAPGGLDKAPNARTG
jgi:hypothetical protein